jgi:acyl carrier protein
MSADAPARTADIARVTQAIFRAIDQLNQGRAPAQRLARSEGAVLIGKDAVLDSLGLVNFVVAVEEEVAEAFGVSVNIADEKARTHPHTPFATVRSLAAYIGLLLEEQAA